MARLYSNQESAAALRGRARPRPRDQGRRRVRAARGAGADRRQARRHVPAAQARSTRRSRSGSAASTTTAARRTWRGSATCTARSAPGFGRRATARARSPTTSAGSTCSRTGRPRSSSCGSTRKRPRSTCIRATTCSRSMPPRRRCAWPRGSASREPRAALTGSSAASSAASATPSGPARTSSNRSSWRAAPIRPRRSGRCSRWASITRSPRPTTPPPIVAYGEGLELAERIGDVPSQVELQASLGTVAVHRGEWGKAELPYRDGRRPGRARGPDRQALLPPPSARRAAAAKRRLRGRGSLAATRGRSRRERRPLRGDGPGPALAGGRAARSGALRRLRPGAGHGRSTSASGRGWSPSRSSARLPGR